MELYLTPGIYRQEVFPAPAVELRTGVPAFLGFAGAGAVALEPHRLTLWSQFVSTFGGDPASGHLGAAVRGFFDNDGNECWVVALEENPDAEKAWEDALATLTTLDAVDLVCAPDALRSYTGPEDSDGLDTALAVQRLVLEHCTAEGERFALLDALPGASIDQVVDRQRPELDSLDGALYYPWVRPLGGAAFVPPCGHVAGVVARTDARFGVHKAPANEILEGVLDLEVGLTNAEQATLNPAGVNALRAFPGRGLRVWGARTLNPAGDEMWTYISVRRLFLTTLRWIERNLTDVVFEPNDPRLWARIVRELEAYFTGLFERGALAGASPREAFFVKCDAETNPPEVREVGRVVTEIGLAPGVPNEFVVVRIVQATSSVEPAASSAG